MTLDWCPGIRKACEYWRDAPMPRQTFEAMERNLEQNNDACIDCAKTVVEVVCRVVVESFHPQQVLIDAHLGQEVYAEDSDSPTLRFLPPGDDEQPINIEVSRLLYQLD